MSHTACGGAQTMRNHTVSLQTQATIFKRTVTKASATRVISFGKCKIKKYENNRANNPPRQTAGGAPARKPAIWVKIFISNVVAALPAFETISFSFIDHLKVLHPALSYCSERTPIGYAKPNETQPLKCPPRHGNNESWLQNFRDWRWPCAALRSSSIKNCTKIIRRRQTKHTNSTTETS